MVRTALPTHKKVRYFAHKALRALGFVNLNLLLKHPHPVPATLSILIGPSAEARTDLPLPSVPVGQGSPGHLQIPIVDWDILFRAIQSRLTETVGDRPESAPAPQAGDAAGHIQVMVLECVAAMELLRKALMHGRT
ncbi:MAG: hypothetical protein ACYCZ6_14125 [Polaromonas sp.]